LSFEFRVACADSGLKTENSKLSSNQHVIASPLKLITLPPKRSTWATKAE